MFPQLAKSGFKLAVHRIPSTQTVIFGAIKIRRNFMFHVRDSWLRNNGEKKCYNAWLTQGARLFTRSYQLHSKNAVRASVRKWLIIALFDSSPLLYHPRASRTPTFFLPPRCHFCNIANFIVKKCGTKLRTGDKNADKTWNIAQIDVVVGARHVVAGRWSFEHAFPSTDNVRTTVES